MERNYSFDKKLKNENGDVIKEITESALSHTFTYSNEMIDGEQHTILEGGYFYNISITDNRYDNIINETGKTYNSSNIYIESTLDIDVQTYQYQDSSNIDNNNGFWGVIVNTPSKHYTYILYKLINQTAQQISITEELSDNIYTFYNLEGECTYKIEVRDSRYENDNFSITVDGKRIKGPKQTKTITYVIRNIVPIKYNIEHMYNPLVLKQNTGQIILKPTFGFGPFILTLYKILSDDTRIKIGDSISSSINNSVTFNGLEDNSKYSIGLLDNRNYMKEIYTDESYSIIMKSSNLNEVTIISGDNERATIQENNNGKIIVTDIKNAEPPYKYIVYDNTGNNLIKESDYLYDKNPYTFTDMNGGSNYIIKAYDSRIDRNNNLFTWTSPSIFVKYVIITINSITSTQPTDRYASDGTITVSVYGGLKFTDANQDYKFILQKEGESPRTPVYGTSPYTFNGLSIGRYNVKVFDNGTPIESDEANIEIFRYPAVVLTSNDFILNITNSNTINDNNGYIDVKIKFEDINYKDDIFKYTLYKDVNNIPVLYNTIIHTYTPTELNEDVYAVFSGLSSNKYYLVVESSKTLYIDENGGIYITCIVNKDVELLEYEIINTIIFDGNITSTSLTPRLLGFDYEIYDTIDQTNFTKLVKTISKTTSNISILYDAKTNTTIFKQINSYIGDPGIVGADAKLSGDPVSTINSYEYNIRNLNFSYKYGTTNQFYTTISNSNLIPIINNGNNILGADNIYSVFRLYDYNKINSAIISVSNPTLNLWNSNKNIDLNFIISISLTKPIESDFILNSLSVFKFYQIYVGYYYRRLYHHTSDNTYALTFNFSDFNKVYSYNSTTGVLSIGCNKTLTTNISNFVSGSEGKNSIKILKQSSNEIIMVSKDNSYIDSVILTNTSDMDITNGITSIILNTMLSGTNTKTRTIKPKNYTSKFNFGVDSINLYYDVENTTTPLTSDGKINMRILGGKPNYTIYINDKIIYNNVNHTYSAINLSGNQTYKINIKDSLNRYYIKDNSSDIYIFIGSTGDVIDATIQKVSPTIVENNTGSITVTVTPATISKFGATYSYKIEQNDDIIYDYSNGITHTFSNLIGGLTYIVTVYNNVQYSFIKSVYLEPFISSGVGVNVTVNSPTSSSNDDGYFVISKKTSETGSSFRIFIYETSNIQNVIYNDSFNFATDFTSPTTLIGGDTYTLYIENSDDTSKFYENTFFITEYMLTTITINATLTNPSIEANNNGSISVIITSNNTGPYTYKCETTTPDINSIITTKSDKTIVFNGLVGGITYTITVIDNNNISWTRDYHVENVRKIVYTITEYISISKTSTAYLYKVLGLKCNIDYSNTTPVLWKNIHTIGYDGNIEHISETTFLTVKQVNNIIDFIPGGISYDYSLSNFTFDYRDQNDEIITGIITTDRTDSVTIGNSGNVILYDKDVNVSLPLAADQQRISDVSVGFADDVSFVGGQYGNTTGGYYVYFRLDTVILGGSEIFSESSQVFFDKIELIYAFMDQSNETHRGDIIVDFNDTNAYYNYTYSNYGTNNILVSLNWYYNITDFTYINLYNSWCEAHIKPRITDNIILFIKLNNNIDNINVINNGNVDLTVGRTLNYTYTNFSGDNFGTHNIDIKHIQVIYDYSVI